MRWTPCPPLSFGYNYGQVEVLLWQMVVGAVVGSSSFTK
jgi:hypothetical protein